MNAADTYTIVERLRASLEIMLINVDGQGIKVTASFGFISMELLDKAGLDVERVLHLADQMLYQAKSTGRNCIVAYPSSVNET